MAGGSKPAELLANYKFMLEAFFYSTRLLRAGTPTKNILPTPWRQRTQVRLSSFADWQQQNFHRLAYRAEVARHDFKPRLDGSLPLAGGLHRSIPA